MKDNNFVIGIIIVAILFLFSGMRIKIELQQLLYSQECLVLEE